jgi:MFS family permease
LEIRIFISEVIAIIGMSDLRQAQAEAALHDQTNLLPRAKLLVVFPTLALAFLVAYADQNGIAIAFPFMARDLHASDTISWAGTSSLIGNTVFQFLYGRLSDIFGRKKIYLTAVILLAVGDLLCATAQKAEALYFFRALTGIAMGGINSLTMMIVSDIVTLQQRGYYQGILGGCIGLGNLVGPFISAAFAQNLTWRGYFYLLSPLAAVCGTISWFLLPTAMPKGKAMENVRLIDWYGLGCGTVATIFFLVPISGAGIYFEWQSPMVISFLSIAGVAGVAFLLVEWKVAALPMMPCKFESSPLGGLAKFDLLSIDVFEPSCRSHTSSKSFVRILLLYGDILSSNIFRKRMPTHSNCRSSVTGSILRGSNGLQCRLWFLHLKIRKIHGSDLGWFCSLDFVSVSYLDFSQSRNQNLSDIGVNGSNRGVGLMIMFDENTHPAIICVVCAIHGSGVGNVFQPTLIALQAHCRKAQRVVVISNRNFLRSLGGSLGLGASSLVMQTQLKRSLPAEFSYLANSAYKLPDFSALSPSEEQAIIHAYQKDVQMVFITITPLMGLCLVGCVFIKDRGLQRKEEKDGGQPISPATESSTIEMAQSQSRLKIKQ